MTDSTHRRDFLKATGAIALTAAAAGGVRAAGSDIIKVGLIGCGGRGRGAIGDCLAADKSIHVVAVGDVFKDKADYAANELKKKKQFEGRVNIGENVFGGIDNFQKVIDTAGVDLIILATPPGFRPTHLEAAIKAKKHVFTEKPVAVDAPGIRKVLALVDEANKNGTAVGAGTQRRHQKAYVEVYKMIQDGLIGEIIGGRCAWNNSGIWFKPRKELEAKAKRKLSDVEYQLDNWYHFNWLCGDHITEQHVHNLDVINWFTGQHPLRASGMGGRLGGHAGRPNGTPDEVGNIFDHFAVELEYANGVKIASYCRHYPGPSDCSELVVGTKGTIYTSAGGGYKLRTGETSKELYSVEQDKKDTNPYVQEHIDLIASIKAGKPINELKNVAESTMTAILARTSTYTGQNLTWDKMMASKMDTMPKDLQIDGNLPVSPVPIPGVTKFA